MANCDRQTLQQFQPNIFISLFIAADSSSPQRSLETANMISLPCFFAGESQGIDQSHYRTPDALQVACDDFPRIFSVIYLVPKPYFPNVKLQTPHPR
jgi:hypothetical protein